MLAIYNSIRLMNTGKRNNVKVLIFSKKNFAIIIIMQTLRSNAEVIFACMYFCFYHYNSYAAYFNKVVSC